MKNYKITELPNVRFNELLSKNENKQTFCLASFCCPPPPLFLVFNRIELRRVAHSKCLAIREGTNGCNLCRRVHRHKPLDAHLSCTATMLWRPASRPVSWACLAPCSQPPKPRVSLQGTLPQSKVLSRQNMISMAGSNLGPWFHNPKTVNSHDKE